MNYIWVGMELAGCVSVRSFASIVVHDYSWSNRSNLWSLEESCYLLQREEILGKLFWYILSEDFRHLSIILIYKLLEDIALHLQRVLEDGREHWKLVSVIKYLTLSFPLGLTESKRVVVIFNNREEWCRWKDSVRLISIISLRVSRKLTVHVEREPAPSLGG